MSRELEGRDLEGPVSVFFSNNDRDPAFELPSSKSFFLPGF